jgi:hypothetical protein
MLLYVPERSFFFSKKSIYRTKAPIILPKRCRVASSLAFGLQGEMGTQIIAEAGILVQTWQEIPCFFVFIMELTIKEAIGGNLDPLQLTGYSFSIGEQAVASFSCVHMLLR